MNRTRDHPKKYLKLFHPPPRRLTQRFTVPAFRATLSRHLATNAAPPLSLSPVQVTCTARSGRQEAPPRCMRPENAQIRSASSRTSLSDDAFCCSPIHATRFIARHELCGKQPKCRSVSLMHCVCVACRCIISLLIRASKMSIASRPCHAYFHAAIMPSFMPRSQPFVACRIKCVTTISQSTALLAGWSHATSFPISPNAKT